VGPAQTALVQAIVPADMLGDANGALQTAQQGMRLVTPLAGAGLFAIVGPVPVIVGDAATFLVAVATLLAISVRERRAVPAGRRWLTEMTAGARHIARTVPLRQLTVTAAIVVTAYGLSETIPFTVVSHGLHKSAPFVGILTAAQRVGAIIAGVAAGPLMRKLSEAMLAVLGMICASAGYVLLIPCPVALGSGRQRAARSVAVLDHRRDYDLVPAPNPAGAHGPDRRRVHVLLCGAPDSGYRGGRRPDRPAPLPADVADHRDSHDARRGIPRDPQGTSRC
jgi:uncharacterized membrane protein